VTPAHQWKPVVQLGSAAQLMTVLGHRNFLVMCREFFRVATAPGEGVAVLDIRGETWQVRVEKKGEKP
jgi:hypothetical protein